MACKELSELRLVLLGCAGAGKSSTANAILGTEDFRETEITKCEMSSRIVEGRNISVIDTPGMNDTSLTEEQWRTEIQRCAILSHPGPHAFLLVIRLWNFTKEDRKAVQWIQEHFGEEALKFTVILFTGREELSRRQWRKFSEDAQTLDFIKNFRPNYFAMNSKREVDPNQIKKLLEMVETVVQDNGGLYYPQDITVEETHKEERQNQESKKQTPESKSSRKAEGQTKQNQETSAKGIKSYWNKASGASACVKNASSYERDRKSLGRHEIKRQEKSVNDLFKKKKELESIRDLRRQIETRRENEREKWKKEREATGRPDLVSDLRIVLLGGTEVETSSSGNTFLGREAFGKDCFTDTIDACREDGVLENKTITVVDTNHLFDSDNLMDQCFALCPPGPHVFLVVVLYPSDSIDTISSISRAFGSEILKHTLILMTHEGLWRTGAKELVQERPYLQKFIDLHEVGCHVFNNKEKEDRTQVTELLDKIQVLVQKNEGRCYTAEMYQTRKKILEPKNKVSDLGIVLLGRSGAGKSSSGNTILGREAFGKECFTDTIDAWRQDGVLENKTITVVDTGHLFDLICEHILNHELAQKYSDNLMDQCLALCPPGPHVFLAVVSTVSHSYEMISFIGRVFGSEFLKHTLILITYGDLCKTNAGRVLQEKPGLQMLINMQKVEFHIFNNKKIEDRTQVTELLEKIQVLVQKNEGRCFTAEMYGNRKKIQVLVPKNKVSDLRIVLLGHTKVGKSSSGNTILGREAFGKERFTDTIDAWRQDGVLENKTITVVDTGHLFDLIFEHILYDALTQCFSDKLMDQCLALCPPGPHVFLAVVPHPSDLRDMISFINKAFGSEFLKHTLILITHGDKCRKDTKKLLEERPDFQKLIDEYGVGCHIFNNKKDIEDRTQVTELLEKIQDLVQKNDGRCYTTKMYRNRKNIKVLVPKCYKDKKNQKDN